MNCIIEARHPDHGNNWDSDYVSNETWSLKKAREWIRMMKLGEEMPDGSKWDDAWEFRILADDGDGNYRIEV